MRAVTILYAGSLQKEALEPVFDGKCALYLALERAKAFPGTEKLVLFTSTGSEAASGAAKESDAVLVSGTWNEKSLLEAVSSAAHDYEAAYFAWADSPFLDPSLAGRVAERHEKWAADYSYADGWPSGLAPECITAKTAAILATLADEKAPVTRETLFSVLSRDINAFDLETEVSGTDFREKRLNLAADSRLNLVLLTRLYAAGCKDAENITKFITEQPESLRSLPSCYYIQITDFCPQKCRFCPFSAQFSSENANFIDFEQYCRVLDKIERFSGEAVIDLSLWGEVSAHPRKLDIIREVLRRPSLSLVIETRPGALWTSEDLAAIQEAVKEAEARKNGMPPLSWILSLDAGEVPVTEDGKRVGKTAAVEKTLTIMEDFPQTAYIQAICVHGEEVECEAFYRAWKAALSAIDEAAGTHVIMQKYDWFCGLLPQMRSADISPVRRNPCWHLCRDMNILLDGSVPVCREEVASKNAPDAQARILGSAFSGDLDEIWRQGQALFDAHCAEKYPGLCGKCDEYYTFAF